MCVLGGACLVKYFYEALGFCRGERGRATRRSFNVQHRREGEGNKSWLNVNPEPRELFGADMKGVYRRVPPRQQAAPEGSQLTL